MSEEPIEITFPPDDEMLKAVGKGIQAYASAEHGLTYLFQCLMDPADRRLSFLVMDSARHIETKKQIVTAVVQARLTGDHRRRANNLLNRLGRRGDVRNALAHWAVSLWPGASSLDEFRRQTWVLAPPSHSRHWMPVMWDSAAYPVKPIKKHQIEEFTKLCHKLFGDFIALANEVAAARKDGAEDDKDVGGGDAA